MNGRRGIGRRADPARPWGDAVAAAALVRRPEPVIRRRDRARLRMQGTGSIAVIADSRALCNVGIDSVRGRSVRIYEDFAFVRRTAGYPMRRNGAFQRLCGSSELGTALRAGARDLGRMVASRARRYP
jgi:hypothetical protein